MRAIIGRVKHAKIDILKENETTTNNIENGLVVYLGVMEGDTEKQAEYLAKKICDLRIFNDENDKMNFSLKDIKGDILIVSNFTLSANCRHGRRPAFDKAAKPKEAEILYNYFVELVKKDADVNKVATGEFGEHMEITSLNDGPINIILDTDIVVK